MGGERRSVVVQRSSGLFWSGGCCPAVWRFGSGLHHFDLSAQVPPMARRGIPPGAAPAVAISLAARRHLTTRWSLRPATTHFRVTHPRMWLIGRWGADSCTMPISWPRRLNQASTAFFGLEPGCPRGSSATAASSLKPDFKPNEKREPALVAGSFYCRGSVLLNAAAFKQLPANAFCPVPRPFCINPPNPPTRATSSLGPFPAFSMN